MNTELNTTTTIEDEMIIEKVNELVQKSKKIARLIKKDKANQINSLIITKKIIGIKSILDISELGFEYYEEKEKLYKKLNNILSCEEKVIESISINEFDSEKIKLEFNNIKINIEEIEKTMYKYINYTLLAGNKYTIKNHIKNYKQKLTYETNNISELCNEKLKEISEQISQKELELNELSNKKEELHNKINDLEKSLVEKENNIILKFNELNNKNNQLSQDAENMISHIKEDAINSHKNMEQELKEKYSKLEQQTKEKFDIFEKEIEKKDIKISELIGIIGNKANIGEYKSNADSAHKERIKWQIATIVIFGIAFLMMLLITFLTKDYNITTIARYIVSVILLGMSGYTAKQASNLGKDEVYYRKQQLELSSIDIYLDDMPESLKEKIKETLSNKMFGQARETYQNKYDDETNNILEKILTIIKEKI